jgi:threonine aldolase
MLKARHFRKLLGGGTRQCGILVAAAKYSFDKVFPQLPDVHKRAAKLAKALHEVGALITTPCDTNMVFVDVSPLGFTTADLCKAGAALQPFPIVISSSRLVLHHQITDQTLDDVVALVKDLKEQHEGHARRPDPALMKASLANAEGRHEGFEAVDFAKREYGPK